MRQTDSREKGGGNGRGFGSFGSGDGGGGKSSREEKLKEGEGEKSDSGDENPKDTGLNRKRQQIEKLNHESSNKRDGTQR